MVLTRNLQHRGKRLREPVHLAPYLLRYMLVDEKDPDIFALARVALECFGDF